MRATTTMIVTVTLALAAIALAVAAPGGGDAAPARAALRAASGTVTVANSHAGQALFEAAGTRPGVPVSGTVTIGNDGDRPGRFSLAVTGVTESAGVHGGLLSTRLRLVVQELAGAPVYDGELDFEPVDLGTFAPGKQRTYEVQAVLPDGGVPGSATTGDNQFQGASLTLGLEWRATPLAASTPTPTPAPEIVPPAPEIVPPAPEIVPPTATPTPEPVASSLGLPSAKRCVRRGRLKVRLKPPAGTKLVAATVYVDGRVKARLKGAKARKAVKLRGLRKRRTRLKVRVKANDGHTYTAGRTYRACKR